MSVNTDAAILVLSEIGRADIAAGTIGNGRTPAAISLSRDTMASDKLSAMQERFVLFYLGGKEGPDGFRPFHGTKSAIAAGYSARSAHAQASALLKEPKVSARIQEELDAAAMPAKAVLNELADIGLAPWHEFVTVRMDPKTGETLDVRMDMSAKVKSLELVGKHHKLFTDNVEHGAAESFLTALRDFGRGDGSS